MRETRLAIRAARGSGAAAATRGGVQGPRGGRGAAGRWPPARAPPRSPSTSRGRRRAPHHRARPLPRPRAVRAVKSSVALRHSRALNVGTFHTPTERLLSTQVARNSRSPCSAGSSAPGELRGHARAHAPPLPGGVPSLSPRRGRVGAHANGRERAVESCSSTRRTRRAAPVPARAAPPGPGRCVGGHLISARGPSSSTPLRADLARARHVRGARGASEARALASADVLVAASDGAAPAPGSCCARSTPASPSLASRWRSTRRPRRRRHGLLFEPATSDARRPTAEARRQRGAARQPPARPRRREQPWQRVDDGSGRLRRLAGARHAAPATRDRARLRTGRHRRRPAHAHGPLARLRDPVEVLLATPATRGSGRSPSPTTT